MKTGVSNLRTTTLANLAERVLAVSKNEKYAVVNGNPLLNAIEKEYQPFQSLVGKSSFSGKGQSVAEADTQRDKVFAGLKLYLKACAGVPLLPNAPLAKDLYEIFKQNDLALDKKSYADQSVLLNKLIEELEKPENKDKLKKLNLETTFGELKAKQTAFEELISSQTEANAELRQTKSASAIRKDLEKALKNYLNFITAMKDQPEYTALYTELKEVVKEIRNS